MNVTLTPSSPATVTLNTATSGSVTLSSCSAAVNLHVPALARANGDMESATYDPRGIADDVFDLANHTGIADDNSITIDGGLI
jgi:hypothetical protein